VPKGREAESDAQHVRAIGMQAQPHRRFMLNSVAACPEIGQGCVRAIAKLEHLPGAEEDSSMEQQRRAAGNFCAAATEAVGLAPLTAAPAAGAAGAAALLAAVGSTPVTPAVAVAAVDSDNSALQQRLWCAIAEILSCTPDWAVRLLRSLSQMAAADPTDKEADATAARAWLKRAWQRTNAAVTAITATLHPQTPERLLLLHLQQCGNAAARTIDTASGLAQLTAALCNTLVCIPGADAALGAAVQVMRVSIMAVCSLEVPHIVDDGMQRAVEHAVVRWCSKRVDKQQLLGRCLQPGGLHALHLLLAAHAAVTARTAVAKAAAAQHLNATAQLAVEADPIAQPPLAAAAAAAAAAYDDDDDDHHAKGREDEKSAAAASKPRKRARGVSGGNGGSSSKRSTTHTTGRLKHVCIYCSVNCIVLWYAPCVSANTSISVHRVDLRSNVGVRMRACSLMQALISVPDHTQICADTSAF
jgi:hypothetical protein